MILVKRNLTDGSKEQEGSLLKFWFSFFGENVVFLLVAASPMLITDLMLGGGIETKILERLYYTTYNTGVNCLVFIYPIYYSKAY